jgi:hypothetical protein
MPGSGLSHGWPLEKDKSEAAHIFAPTRAKCNDLFPAMQATLALKRLHGRFNGGQDRWQASRDNPEMR